MSYCQGLVPSIDAASEILILGSMPGKTSLAEQQYYAHPQNRFWRLMGLLWQEDFVAASYEERLCLLLKHRVALWDTIKSCERVGSLDSDIKNAIGNDFFAFTKEYPSIKLICLNGGASWKYFRRFNAKFIKEECCAFLPLPSTSPANARYSTEMLLEKWGKIKTAL